MLLLVLNAWTTVTVTIITGMVHVRGMRVGLQVVAHLQCMCVVVRLHLLLLLLLLVQVIRVIVPHQALAHITIITRHLIVRDH